MISNQSELYSSWRLQQWWTTKLFDWSDCPRPFVENLQNHVPSLWYLSISISKWKSYGSLSCLKIPNSSIAKGKCKDKWRKFLQRGSLQSTKRHVPIISQQSSRKVKNGISGSKWKKNSPVTWSKWGQIKFWWRNDTLTRVWFK